MKKLLLICAVVGFITACNSSSDADKTDSDTIKPDTSGLPAAPDTLNANLPDTANMPDTSQTDSLRK